MPFCEVKKNDSIKVGATANFGFGPTVEPAVMDCFNNAKSALEELIEKVVHVEKKADFDAYLPIDDSLKLRGWTEYCDANQELRHRTPDGLFEWFKEVEDWTPSKNREVERGIEKTVSYCVDLLSEVDILLTPVMPIVNFPAENLGVDPLMPLRHTTFTAPFNQSGNPAVSICGGFDERGLPIGIQLVGKRLDDARVLQLATDLENVLDIYGSGKAKWPLTPIA